MTIAVMAKGYASGSDRLDVWDHEALLLAIADASAFESAGSNATTATVTRSTADLSAPLVVMLGTSDSAPVSIPSQVVISADASYAFFSLTAVSDGTLDGTQAVTITAMAAGYTAGSDSLSEMPVSRYSSPSAK